MNAIRHWEEGLSAGLEKCCGRVRRPERGSLANAHISHNSLILPRFAGICQLFHREAPGVARLGDVFSAGAETARCRAVVCVRAAANRVDASRERETGGVTNRKNCVKILLAPGRLKRDIVAARPERAGTERTCMASQSPSDAAPAVAPAAPSGMRSRVSALFSLLVIANLGAWACALGFFHAHPLLLGTALLAYSFGLRHAMDADHIAAIDNVTRKLLQQGKRPVGVGFFFSLGHSTVVFGLSVVIALTSVALKRYFATYQAIGGVIGTGVSAFFLLAIAFANLLVLISVFRTFQHVRRGGRFADENLNLLLGKRGFFGRIFRSLFQLINHGWQMYPVGFLFGLGFDTATEVGLLGISATEATSGLPVWAILIFPLLFTVGMALVDTSVSVLMLNAYSWAFVKPMRKLYYNLIVTLVSVLVAVLIGGIELLGLIGDRFKIHGMLWDLVGALNNNFGVVGFAILGVFIVSWVISIAVYRLNRYDDIKVERVIPEG